MRSFLPHALDLNNKHILVTGGTGTFGQAFVKNVLSDYAPARLIIYSRDELKQFDMQQSLKSYPHYDSLRFFIGDVRDRDRLTLAMRGIDYVIHAAALKQIPAAEYNPMECLRTNVNGAENIVRAALDNQVKKVVALSTDKAASPLNLYGASKLASDKIFVAANHLSGSIGTRFSVVRYGNVVGSRGSVIPFFLKLMAEDADHLPITDNRMTRFWITLKQGVAFVLSSLEMMRGGEVFVPKIPSMRINDLASMMAPDLPQRVVGIRPGEKLHEIMITEDDARSTIELDDRYIIEPAFAFWQRAPYRSVEPVPVPEEGFSYASHTNTEWLDHAGMRQLLLDSDIVLPGSHHTSQASSKSAAAPQKVA